ncbi:MAG: transporter substrate-binding domain-containing protein [Paraglaciecola sp.]|uniref:substrate-binding periplasmic protein n=1 Tax=Paraglaciecola sp. TaxID=1920173 RepID=UPI00273DC02F|nr:transporter substrate-binding domain-containing protein [Paraglaciecola sp.]MDP5033161.1 transporter substrate-binding domain-containing protein [Paraglaciecola sp.]MDP5130193.1 transporter substrate-binding domain-containing protein [Paraglaciecola sp.]
MIIIILTPFCHAQHSQTLRGNRDIEGTWVPFDITDDPNNPGIFIELTPLLFQRAKIDFVYSYMPTKRAVKALYADELDFDFVNPDWLSPDDKERFVFSDALFQISEYFISLPVHAKSYLQASSAYGKPVGTVSGYYYYDDEHFKRVDFRSESEVILGLAKKRYDVAIMEQFAARYWSAKHHVPISLGSIHTQGYMVMRLRAEYSHLVPDINKAINSLKQNGEIQRILLHYTNHQDRLSSYE